jgi:hypothetical protein
MFSAGLSTRAKPLRSIPAVVDVGYIFIIFVD